MNDIRMEHIDKRFGPKTVLRLFSPLPLARPPGHHGQFRLRKTTLLRVPAGLRAAGRGRPHPWPSGTDGGGIPGGSLAGGLLPFGQYPPGHRQKDLLAGHPSPLGELGLGLLGTRSPPSAAGCNAAAAAGPFYTIPWLLALDEAFKGLMRIPACGPWNMFGPTARVTSGQTHDPQEAAFWGWSLIPDGCPAGLGCQGVGRMPAPLAAGARSAAGAGPFGPAPCFGSRAALGPGKTPPPWGSGPPAADLDGKTVPAQDGGQVV